MRMALCQSQIDMVVNAVNRAVDGDQFGFAAGYLMGVVYGTDFPHDLNMELDAYITESMKAWQVRNRVFNRPLEKDDHHG